MVPSQQEVRKVHCICKEDGERLYEVLDYSDNVTLYDTVTDDLSGLSGRYMSGLKYWAPGRPTRQETDSLSFRRSRYMVWKGRNLIRKPDMNHFTAFILY